MRNNRSSLTFKLIPILCLAMFSLNAENIHAEELITYDELCFSSFDDSLSYNYYSIPHSMGEDKDYSSIFEPALDYAKELHEDYEGVAGGYNGIAYTLMDLNGDGVKELLVRQMDGREGSHLWVFGIHKGTAYYLGDIWVEGFMPDRLAGCGNGVICITDLDGRYSLCRSEDNEMKNIVNLLLEPGEDIPDFDNLSQYYSIDSITDECPGFYDLSDMTLMDQETAIINERMQKYEAGISDDDLLAIYREYADAFSKWCDYLDQDIAAIEAYDYNTAIDNVLYSQNIYISNNIHSIRERMFSLNDFNNDGIPELIITFKLRHEGDTNEYVFPIEILSWSPAYGKVRKTAPPLYNYEFYLLGDDDLLITYGHGSHTISFLSFDGDSFNTYDTYSSFRDDRVEDPERSWQHITDPFSSENPIVSLDEVNQVIESHGQKTYSVFPEHSLAELSSGNIDFLNHGEEIVEWLPSF